jgi:hypothetical protein
MSLCISGCIINYLLGLVYYIMVKLKHTYQKEGDLINWTYLVAPCFILACLFHANSNGDLIGDVNFILYTLGMYEPHL